MTILQIGATYLCLGVLTVVFSDVNPSPTGIGIILLWPVLWLFFLCYTCTAFLSEYKINASIKAIIKEIEDIIKEVEKK